MTQHAQPTWIQVFQAIHTIGVSHSSPVWVRTPFKLWIDLGEEMGINLKEWGEEETEKIERQIGRPPKCSWFRCPLHDGMGARTVTGRTFLLCSRCKEVGGRSRTSPTGLIIQVY